MIFYDEKKRIFHLQTPDTSYVLGMYGDYIVEHLYFGPRLSDIDGIEPFKENDAAFVSHNFEYHDNSIELSTELSLAEYSFFGSCDMRKPSFHAAYEDGSRITKMKYVSHKIFAGKPKLPGLPSTYTESDNEADTLELTVRDELTGLVLVYRYTAFNTYNAITRSVTVKNDGTQTVNLKSVMSLNIDFERSGFDFVNLSGAWARERWLERRSLGTGTTKVESRRGSSSHHQSPFFALCSRNADEDRGDVYGFSLVYSGNFEAGAEVDTYGRTRAFMGINSFDFNWRLEPGEEFNTPEAVAVYSDSGFGKMSREFNRLYRQRLARGKWRDMERPVLINNWEATYFNFDEKKLLEIAKTAKSAGIEMLVLDDGWFGKRNDDTTSLGDWYPDSNKLPNGISGVADGVNKLGLKFGLWFEPEMISPDSDLYRAHPDWCLHVEGRGRSLGRNQLILDLSRTDVCDYIVSFMTDVLSSANIEYVKWDMNRNMTCVGSAKLPPERQPEVYHRYMLGLYDVLEQITSAFPDVLFEGCSGGGGRFDAGMMYYFNQYWTSDDSDAAERMYIQYGTSLVMPSAFMGAHVSAVPNHQVNRTTPLETRGYVAMGGQLGYELDVTKMSDEELAEVKLQIDEYKEVRSVIHNGDMYRIESPFESENCSWAYVAEDKSEAVLFVFKLMVHTSTLPRRVRLRGIDTEAHYRLRGSDEVYSGAVLENYGIKIDQKRDFDATMLIFDRV